MGHKQHVICDKVIVEYTSLIQNRHHATVNNKYRHCVFNNTLYNQKHIRMIKLFYFSCIYKFCDNKLQVKFR